MVNEDIQNIEMDIETARKIVRKRDMLNNLRNNPDFKEIFIDGYLREEAARLVGLKADPNMQEPEQQKFVDDSITGIGVFNQYLMVINQMGNQMENSMKSAERMQETLTEEQKISAVN